MVCSARSDHGIIGNVSGAFEDSYGWKKGIFGGSKTSRVRYEGDEILLEFE